MGKQAVHSMKPAGLVMLCLLVGACSQEKAEEPTTSESTGSDSCETAIREVIDLEFTAPDVEAARIKQEIQDHMTEDLKDAGGIVEHPGYAKGDPELEAFYAYAAETYDSYFTENGFAEFTQSEGPKAFAFHQQNLEYRLKPTYIAVEKIEMEDTDEKFSAFNFNTTLNYQTRFEEGFYNFTGWALCTSEGKISHLTTIDRDELAGKMEEDR